MNPNNIVIGCKAPLIAPHCDHWDENGCTKPFGECSYQYDFQEAFKDPDFDDTGLDGCEPGKSIRRA